MFEPKDEGRSEIARVTIERGEIMGWGEGWGRGG